MLGTGRSAGGEGSFFVKSYGVRKPLTVPASSRSLSSAVTGFSGVQTGRAPHVASRVASAGPLPRARRPAFPPPASFGGTGGTDAHTAAAPEGDRCWDTAASTEQDQGPPGRGTASEASGSARGGRAVGSARPLRESAARSRIRLYRGGVERTSEIVKF